MTNVTFLYFNDNYFDVTGGSQSFRVRPANSSVSEGGDVTLHCAVDNRVGIVQWVKDGFAFVIQSSKYSINHFIYQNFKNVRTFVPKAITLIS